MTGRRLAGGVDLLERAINYTLGSLHLVTPRLLPRPTPCDEWDLRSLLWHLGDSLAALYEAVALGKVDFEIASARDDGDLVAMLRGRASRLLGAWAAADGPDRVWVGDLPLAAGVVARTGAVEVAVHGWDVARACGECRPIPAALAEDLLPVLPMLVTDADRPGRFAEPVGVPVAAGPGERLLAFLGRQPC